MLAWLFVCCEVQVVCMLSSQCHCHPKTSSSCTLLESRMVSTFLIWLTQVILEKRQYALVLSCTVCIVFTALASIAFSLAHFHLSQVSLCITRWFVLCSSAVKSASVMSAATTSDSSPQSLGSGSERMVSIRADYDRRSAMSSLDDMDAGYPSRLVCLVSHISV